MLPQHFVFLDTETTGLYPRKDRIIEVGLIRVENKKEIARFQTLLNPNMHVSPFITDITGILPEQVKDAPEFGDVARELWDFLDDAVLVAHNARFDYGFLKNEFLRIDRTYKTKQLCTAKLSRFLFPKFRHHNLDSIIQRFDISVVNRHRALDDALAIKEFYEKLQQRVNEEKLQSAVQFLLRRPSIPTHLKSKEIENLSDGPGVYIFYGDSNTPLYIGKSVHVKDRVKSHFAADHSENKEMNLSRQVKRIEIIPTSGELGALLKESELIKLLQPIYNRKLRQARRLVVVKELDKNGYKGVIIEDLVEILPNQTREIITTSKSKKQAQEYLHFLAEEHSLCKKLLGLEKGKGACFAYRLGKCKGACIGKESPLAYNARAIIAFSQNKIKDWPFPGPIVITEKNTLEKTTDAFLVDKWCLLGKKTSDENVDGVFEEKDYRFDMDTYKILLGFFNKTKDVSSIHVVKNATSSRFSIVK